MEDRRLEDTEDGERFPLKRRYWSTYTASHRTEP